MRLYDMPRSSKTGRSMESVDVGGSFSFEESIVICYWKGLGLLKWELCLGLLVGGSCVELASLGEIGYVGLKLGR